MCAEHSRQNGTPNEPSQHSLALRRQHCRKPMASSVIVPCVPSKSPPGNANPIVGIRLVRAMFQEGSPRGVLRASCVVHVMRASDSYTLQRTRRSIRC
jgi:hypothetical protein